jgi:hypothetical protein
MRVLLSTFSRHMTRKRWTAYVAVGSIPPDATRFVDDVHNGGLCFVSDDIAQCDLLVLVGSFSAKTAAPLQKVRDRMPVHRVLWFTDDPMSSSIDIEGAHIVAALPPAPGALEAALDHLDAR